MNINTQKDFMILYMSLKRVSISGLEGTVGSQGMGLYGGAHQVYIEHKYVPRDWWTISPMNWR